MAPTLKVFIEPQCEACERAVDLAGQMRARYPDLHVEVVDLTVAGPDRPDEVFAVPTFVLNGRVLSLGNPRRSRLIDAVEAALRKGGIRDGE